MFFILVRDVEMHPSEHLGATRRATPEQRKWENNFEFSMNELGSIDPLRWPTPPKSIHHRAPLNPSQLLQNFQKGFSRVFPIPNLALLRRRTRRRMISDTFDRGNSSCRSARCDFVVFTRFYFGEGDQSSFDGPVSSFD